MLVFDDFDDRKRNQGAYIVWRGLDQYEITEYSNRNDSCKILSSFDAATDNRGKGTFKENMANSEESVRWLKLWGKFTLRLNWTCLRRFCLGLCRTVQQLYDQRDQQLYGRQFDWQACWKYYEFIGLRFHDRKFIWYVSWPVNSDINSCMKNIVKWFMKSGVAKVSDVFSPAVPAGNLKPWWFTGKLRLHTTTTETQVNSYHKYFGLLFPNPEYPTSANSLSRLPFCLGREILGAIQVS